MLRDREAMNFHAQSEELAEAERLEQQAREHRARAVAQGMSQKYVRSTPMLIMCTYLLQVLTQRTSPWVVGNLTTECSVVRSSVDSRVLEVNLLEASSVVDRLVAHKVDNSLAVKVAVKLLADSSLVVNLITTDRADKSVDRTPSSLVAPTPTSKHFT